MELYRRARGVLPSVFTFIRTVDQNKVSDNGDSHYSSVEHDLADPGCGADDDDPGGGSITSAEMIMPP